MGLVPSSVTLIKKRSSGATSHCCLLTMLVPPPQIRVWNNTTGTPGSSVAPLEIAHALPIGAEHNPAPVWRPDAPPVSIRMGCKTRRTSGVEQPKIGIALYGAVDYCLASVRR